MPYTFDMSGRLRAGIQQFPSYAMPHTAQSTFINTDPIRLPQFYAESDHDIQPGHPVQWTGEPTMINNAGQRIDAFSQHDISSALSSVEPATSNTNRLAGIVIEKAASPGDRQFTHKGVHSIHSLPTDSKTLYRVGNNIVLAWVLGESQGEMEGIYQRYVNGTLDTTGPYQLTMVSSDMFTIHRTMQASVELELAELKARFDSLTVKTE